MAVRSAVFTLAVASRLAVSFAQNDTSPPRCVSFGVDFQDGGSYFQNISSSDNFTFVSSFEGCQPDVANNLLVDPNGDEIQCTDTPLTPSDTNELSTCDVLKSQLQPGDWSILVISNNGDAEPIAYERDFILAVGTPTTTTVTPTVTVTITQNTLPDATATVTELDSEAATTTTTVPWRTIAVTRTIRPRTTTTITQAYATITSVQHTANPVYETQTYTATCSVPNKQHHPDPWCRFTPTKVFAAAMATAPPSFRFHRFYDRSVSPQREQRVQERRQRLAELQKHQPQKRSPDSSVVTVEELNTALFPTVTNTFVPPGATGVTVTTVVTSTTTSTETSTVYSGVSRAPVVTETAPLRTITRTKFVRKTSVIETRTHTPTVSVTTTVYPTGYAEACASKGGEWN